MDITMHTHTPIKIRIITTLAAWAVAFVIVFILLSLFGRRLESLPPALNALIFTGILVPIMGNLVMPFLGTAVADMFTDKANQKELQ